MPHPLAVGFACRRWATLPASGGWLDQPVTLFTAVDYALRIYDAITEYERMRKAGGKEWVTWQRENTQVIELVAELAKADNNG